MEERYERRPGGKEGEKGEGGKVGGRTKRNESVTEGRRGGERERETGSFCRGGRGGSGGVSSYKSRGTELWQRQNRSRARPP